MTILAQRFQPRRFAPVPRALLDDVFNCAPFTSGTSGVEISNTENGANVEIAVPGFKASEISVTLDENVLSIHAENERRKLARTLLVPEHLDTENIDVAVANGLLTITFAAQPKPQPRSIAVREAVEETATS